MFAQLKRRQPVSADQAAELHRFVDTSARGIESNKAGLAGNDEGLEQPQVVRRIEIATGDNERHAI